MIRKIFLVAGVAAGALALSVWDTQREVTKAIREAWKV